MKLTLNYLLNFAGEKKDYQSKLENISNLETPFELLK
jgi:hypothetical protein